MSDRVDRLQSALAGRYGSASGVSDASRSTLPEASNTNRVQPINAFLDWTLGPLRPRAN